MSVNPKQARQTLGLNQSTMARLMGVHRQTWVKWERGERKPPAVAIRMIDILLVLKTEHPFTFDPLRDF
jgi:DNA-binding transcriptional regulator YiaG